MSKKLRLPQSEMSTEWMDICRNLDRNYKLKELRDIAENVLDISVSTLSKREICRLLAYQFTSLKFPGQHISGCKNDESLTTLEVFNELPKSEYVKDEFGYCFTYGELNQYLKHNIPHPFTNIPLDKVKTLDKKKNLKQVAITGKSIPLKIQTIHQEYPKGITYQSLQKIKNMLSQLRAIETRKLMGNKYYYSVIKDKYNDIEIDPENFYVDPKLAGDFLKRSKIIRDLNYQEDFERNGSLINFVKKIINILQETRQYNFGKLQRVKKAIIESFYYGYDDELPENITSGDIEGWEALASMIDQN